MPRPPCCPLFLLLFATTSLFAFNGIPSLTQGFAPGTVVPGSSGFTLTVTGSGFATTATVNWNGSPRATTFASTSQLTANILATDVKTPQVASITVTNPGPGGGTSNPAYFGVTISSGTIRLLKESRYLVGNGANAIAVGDINSDGILDIVTANHTSDNVTNSISILLGNGGGKFSKKTDFATGLNPRAVAIGDMNGDGIADIITVGGDGGVHGSQVSVLLGDGHGFFSAHTDYAGSSRYPFGTLSLADIDGDGHLDVVASGPFNGVTSIYIFYGNGDGTLQPSVEVPSTGDLFAARVADINHDGIPDLVAGTNQDQVAVLLGTGGGNFAPLMTQTGIQFASTFTVADFNQDGNSDIAVVDNFSEVTCLQMLLGNGDGTFILLPTVAVNYSGGPLTASAYDFNGDGLLDILLDDAPGLGPNNYFVGNGDGSFQAGQLLSIPESYVAPSAIGDFNHDGRMDVATLEDAFSPFVRVFLQDPVSLSPTIYTFPSLAVGRTSARQYVTLTNAGTTTIQINGVTVTGMTSQFATSNYCGSKLAGGQSCKVAVKFAPSQSWQTQAASITITINSTAPESSEASSLSGFTTN